MPQPGHPSSNASPPYRRHRFWLATALVLVVALGVASRAYPWLFSSALGSYPGDALWALMVFLGIAFIKPVMPTSRVACAALAFSWLI